MKQQRTLNEALQLSPEQRSFVDQSSRKTTLCPPEEFAVAASGQTCSDPRPKRKAEPNLHWNANVPSGLLPLTTRLHPDTAERLRSISLQRKLDRVSPSTQQEIVEEALRQWLGDHAM